MGQSETPGRVTPILFFQDPETREVRGIGILNNSYLYQDYWSKGEKIPARVWHERLKGLFQRGIAFLDASLEEIKKEAESDRGA
ncbi:MAG: hypothetical protein JXP34_21975 [Planctomycetes bacterium]|nr:hypothetical protein [Planctomycetota bacterium]